MAAQWHYTKGGDRHGPVSNEQLRQLAASGQLGPTDLVWRDGMAEWQKASSVKGLFPSPTSGPPEPPPIPHNPPPAADPGPTTQQPTAGQSEKHGLRGTLSTLGQAAKTAAVVATKEAERAKITNVDLPKAYAALGRDVHGRGAYREQFSDLYQQIDDLLASLRNLQGDPPKQPSSPATFADKAKAASVATKQKAEAQAMRLHLSRLMSKLGEAVYERHGTAASSPETTGPIAALLSRASTLAAEVERRRQASGGRFITRRRALAAAGMFCACVIFVGVVGKMAPNSHNTPITAADALTPVRQLAEDSDPPIPQPQSHDFSQDDYDSIPKGATRATAEEQLENEKWIVSQGYRLSDGTFVSHGPHTVWWDKARTKKAGDGANLNGNLHGVLTRLYPNGARETEVTFVHGLRHGLEREWSDDGSLQRETTWVNGKKQGTEREFFEDGKKKTEKTWNNGSWHGPYSEWTSNGAERRRGEYRDGEPVGIWRIGFPKAFASGLRYVEIDAGTPTVGTRAELLAKLNLWNSVLGVRVAFFDPFRCKGSGRMPSKEKFFSICGSPVSDEPRERHPAHEPYLRRWVYRCTDGSLELDIQIDRKNGIVWWATVIPE